MEWNRKDQQKILLLLKTEAFYNVILSWKSFDQFMLVILDIQFPIAIFLMCLVKNDIYSVKNFYEKAHNFEYLIWENKDK